ncbi:hypothetical protein NF681_11460 [Comamonadaceae bacterium OTU4NAUVB1]|nr:hypothetical protein NF681_11460 [Comamonadaceae bacterium OTU4NAUVB1]
MIPTNSAFQATGALPQYGELALVELQLRSGTARYTTWPVTLTALGVEWQGTGNLGSISQLHESEDGAEEKLTLSLSPVDFGTRALALGDPGDYQDRPVRVWVGLVSTDTFQLVGAPVLRFSGVMDQLKLPREGNTGSIALDCRTASYDVRSNPAALRMNNVQHQQRHPGERGFEFLSSLIGNEAVWLTKRFQADANARARARG